MATKRRSPRLAKRFEAVKAEGTRCVIPGCGRPSVLSERNGFTPHTCRYHIQHKARHGSHWHPSYTAQELRPYLITAKRWIAAQGESPSCATVSPALRALQALMGGAGPIQHVNALYGKDPKLRARAAFARVREAGISAERLLAIHLAVAMLIEEDLGSHRVPEFCVVQVAKCVHRLASGTHRHWDIPMRNGQPDVHAELHVYPRSSGQVLRHMGNAIDEICGSVTRQYLAEVLAAKVESYGQHSSYSPGWRPVRWTSPKQHGAQSRD